MQLKDREAMKLEDISEIAKAGQKIPKKILLSFVKHSYKHLDKDQIAGIFALIEKMIVAKQNGEKLTVAFRDWNEDGTRRF